MDKNQYLDELIEQCRALPLSQVLGGRIVLHGRAGGSQKAICPFHADKTMGSFVSTDRKGVWKCFSCGAGGDGVKFISLFDGVDYVQAAFEVALEYGIITEGDYEENYKRKRYKKADVRNIQRRFEKEDLNRNSTKQEDPSVLDRVYSLFLKGTKLNLEHEVYLERIRRMTEAEIENGKYFTFPTQSIMRNFVEDIKKEFGSDKVLGNVPGFYYKTDEEKWMFPKNKGIGIPIMNAVGEIVGIQIRRDQKGAKASRYNWLSSSFAQGMEGYEFGTSSGSPVDVSIPETITNTTVMITEGRFKASLLARETGSIVLSIQGVGSWFGVFNELEQLSTSEKVKKAYNGKEFILYSVMLAFDADISSNLQVCHQMKKLSDGLEEKRYPTYYLHWNEKLGKGVDDMIVAGHKSKIQRFEKRVWDRTFSKLMKDLILTEKIVEMKDITREMFSSYFDKHMPSVKPLPKGELSEMHLQLLEKKEEISV